MISLYEKTATVPETEASNGICVLSPTSCNVHEIAGGEYELEMEHPMDSDGKYLMLTEERIIKAPVPVMEIPETEMPELTVWKVTQATDLYSKTPVTKYSGDNWQKILKVKNNPSRYAYNSLTFYNYGALVHWGGVVYEATQSSINVQPDTNWLFWKSLGSISSVQTNYDPGVVIRTLAINEKVVKISDAGKYIRVRVYGGSVYGFVLAEALTEQTERVQDTIPAQTIKDQLFRIYEVSAEDETSTVTVRARHISYDFQSNALFDCKVTNVNPTEAVAAIQMALVEEDLRTIATNISSGEITADWSFKNPVNAILDPDNGVVGKLRARLIRNNNDFYILDSSTNRTGITIAYGVNMVGVNWTRNIENVVTRVIPRSGTSDKGYLYISNGGKISGGTVQDQGKMYVESEIADQYSRPRYSILNCSYSVGQEYEKADGTKAKYTEQEVLAKMLTDAAETFTKNHADGVDVTLEVEFLLLGDTEEFKQYKGLQTVCLYDIVKVRTGKSRIDAEAQVTEYDYDCIRKRYNSIKLGTINSFTKRIAGYRFIDGSITYEKLSSDLINRILTGNATGSTDSDSTSGSTSGGGVVITPPINSKTDDGLVTKGTGKANKVWKTDGQGNPAWRDESANGATAIQANDDLNDYKTPGMYYSTGESISSTLSNIPDAMSDQMFTLEVQSDGGNYFQVIDSVTQYAGYEYIRKTTSTGTVWGNWQRTNWTANSRTAAGFVAAGNGQPNKIWKTDGSGNPDWRDDYSLPLAANGTRGGIQVGYTASGKNYPVKLSSEKAYVTVPGMDDTAFSGDIDTLLTPGRYYLAAATSTAESLTNLYGTLLVEGNTTATDGNRVTQLHLAMFSSTAWFRRYTSAGWQDAQYVLRQSDIKNNLTTTAAGSVLDATQGKALSDRIAYFEGIAIPANANMNNYTTPGMFYSTGSAISSTLTNIPPSAADQMFVLQVYSDGENYFQFLTYQTSYVANTFVRRTGSSGASWLDWKNTAPTLITNLTTTTEGYALDATQGKVLNDKFSDYSLKTYTNVSQLGLSGAQTILAIWDKMPVGSTFVGYNGDIVSSDQPVSGFTLVIIKSRDAARGTITATTKNNARQWFMGLGASTYNGNNANKPNGAWVEFSKNYFSYSGGNGATLTHTFAIARPFIVVTSRSGTTNTGAIGMYAGFAGSSNSQILPLFAPSAGVTSMTISGLTLTMVSGATNMRMSVIEL